MRLFAGHLKNFLILLPPLLLAVQAVDYLASGYLAYIRAFALCAIVLSFYLRRHKKLDSVSYLILLFLLYTIIPAFNSSNYQIPLPGYLSIFVSMSFYLIAYNVISKKEDFIAFKKLLYLVPMVFLGNVIMNLVFGIGEGVYGGEEVLQTGSGLHHNTILTAVLIVVLSFMLIKYSNHKARDVILLTGMNIVILLSFRRTAIILTVVAFCIYFLMSKKKDALKYLAAVSFILIVLYPFYSSPFQNVMEARGDRATFERGLEREARYMEVKTITERVLNFHDPYYSLFGMEYLNSFGTYGSWLFPVPMGRILHTDYAVILHGSGIFGLGIYFCILVAFIRKIAIYAKALNISNSFTIMAISFVTILFASTFSGGLLNISYRTSLFLFLGAVCRISDDLSADVIKRRRRG